MPIPLAYYHCITCLNFFTCMLYAYASGCDKKVGVDLGWASTLVLLFGFLGMQEVAMQLSDPFGDDDCDLPVDFYVHNCMNYLHMYVDDKSETEVMQWKQGFKKEGFWAQGRLATGDASKELDGQVTTAFLSWQQEDSKRKNDACFNDEDCHPLAS